MPPGWLSFKELDAALGLPKGGAFRAFKRLEPGLREGTDYRVLVPGRDDDALESLRRGGRIYASTVNLVLLSPAAAARVRAALQG
ncbi:MAG: hypothetical protein HYV18_08665 [Gammaproteobacteria bacterium]|nr:hypothetical protein [Gammaproteobacteria bacterium]